MPGAWILSTAGLGKSTGQSGGGSIRASEDPQPEKQNPAQSEDDPEEEPAPVPLVQPPALSRHMPSCQPRPQPSLEEDHDEKPDDGVAGVNSLDAMLEPEVKEGPKALGGLLVFSFSCDQAY